MEGFPCRTCLSITGEDGINVVQRCFSNRTIKEILIQFVPRMETTLSDDDRVCRICFKTIKCFMRFLEKCLDIENNHPNQHELAGKNIQSLHLDGNIEIVENIQIVVEDDLQEYFEETDITNNDDSTENMKHDHAYIKLESEDGEAYLEQNDEFIPNGIQEPVDESEETSQDGTYELSQENSTYFQSDSTLITMAEIEAMESDEKEIISIKRENMESSNSIALANEGVTFFEPLEAENVYICDLCGEGFLSELLLKDHLALHEEVSIICDKCPKIFKNSTALKAHYKLKHTEAERYKCDICEQTFARTDYLRNHYKRHEEENADSSKVKCRVPGKFLRFRNTDEPLPCKLCGKYYNGIQKLKVHLQTHLIVKRYKCEFCDLTYKRWPSLKRHEKSHLESNKVFHRCNVCWKRFNTEEELEVHMTQHGNPRYRCQICEEYFHRKYLFDNHYLLKHATEEDIENSKKEIIYNTLLELSNQDVVSQ
ncbi:uncharacterized protein [Leptinotarsa decemlineata]|uniref:uncharacterized protein n=1 Tax=Leptinotarsa decemlineata TaxID=7539 RepID=UPI000C251D5D|nr:zinc finger protein 616-like [Leptinotarsa decemlineata]